MIWLTLLLQWQFELSVDCILAFLSKFWSYSSLKNILNYVILNLRNDNNGFTNFQLIRSISLFIILFDMFHVFCSRTGPKGWRQRATDMRLAGLPTKVAVWEPIEHNVNGHCFNTTIHRLLKDTHATAISQIICRDYCLIAQHSANTSVLWEYDKCLVITNPVDRLVTSFNANHISNIIHFTQSVNRQYRQVNLQNFDGCDRYQVHPLCSSSTSNCRAEFGGTGPISVTPYPYSGGIVNLLLSPGHILWIRDCQRSTI
eukprot:sb/3468514/